MKTQLPLVAVAIGLCLAPLAAAAQEGDPAAGRRYALTTCQSCHAVDKADTRSTDARAPAFAAIAAVRGMTGVALNVALQSSHRTMPNLVIGQEDLANVVAYILSLR